jgi:hypothetical protein
MPEPVRSFKGVVTAFPTARPIPAVGPCEGPRTPSDSGDQPGDAIMDQNQKPPRGRGMMIWLIVDTILSVLAIGPVALMGMMSVMASDSGVNTAVITFIWLGLTFPIAVALSPILGWIAWFLRRERTALILSLLPVLWVIAFIALFAVGFGEPHPA